MRQTSGTRKSHGEKVIKYIRRAMRKQYSAEEKIRIVLDGVKGEESIAELCRREGIAQSLYYSWSKAFLEAGKKRQAGDTSRAASTGEVKDLRREAQELKEVLAISYWSLDRLSVDSLKTDLARLQSAGLEASFMETVPTDQKYDPLKRAQEAMENDSVNCEGIQLAEHEEDMRQLRMLFARAFSEADVDVLLPQDFLCDEFACDYWKNRRPLYFDSNHLTFT